MAMISSLCAAFLRHVVDAVAAADFWASLCILFAVHVVPATRQ